MNNHKNNALAYACRSNTNIRIIDLLLKYGANVNIQDTLDGTSPLMKAIRAKASPQVIAALLEAGADTTIYDRNHKSVLQQAKEYHPQIVELLLQHGAN